jgi:alanyl-tRNA synthetase
LNEIKLALKNPQDVIKAVVSVQEENAKLKKQVELIRDKAKGLKTELATNQEINGIQFLHCKWILTQKELKIWHDLGNLGTNMF